MRFAGRSALLDHSSIDALLADLERHRGRVFRFESGTRTAGGGLARGAPWELVHAEIFASVWCNGPWLTLHLRVRFTDGTEESRYLKPSPRCDGWMTGRRIDSDDGSDFRVLLLDGSPADGSLPNSASADNLPRQRLDDNLRSVFA